MNWQSLFPLFFSCVLAVTFCEQASAAEETPAGQVPASAENVKGVRLLTGKVSDFKYYGGGDASSIIKVVPVTDQPFTEALQVDTFARGGVKGESGLTARIATPVKKGDVLWISFKARKLKSSRESGEAFFSLRLDHLVDGKYKWPPYLERGISVSGAWTDISIPFVTDTDVTSAGSRVIIVFDEYSHQFELGPITLINCGPDVKLTDLPKSVVRYEGDEPDAPWRKEAAERIERLRKGDLAIKVVDGQGNPVGEAKVSVQMKRIAFNFGTAITSERIIDATKPDNLKYRETLQKYFNQVVFDNEMKWPKWTRPDDKHESTLQALDWLKENNITARGHVMVWPSWKQLPRFMSGLKDDKDALRAAVYKHITEQTSVMKGRFVEWDVTNEIYKHHDLVDLLGTDEVVKWYEAAHTAAPEVKLFYNEYTMFHADGPGLPSDHFFDTVKLLKEKGAPINGIGEQAHIGGTPPPIPLVLARLDKFATLGLPITITEFDITSNDEDFQANYLRDFLTAVFSHPSTIGFVQWGFWEGHHWIPAGALWNRDWTIRKHGEMFTEMIKTWRTDAAGLTASDGTYQVRAFLGDYRVSVTHGDQTVTSDVTLVPGATVQTVTLP